MERSRRRVHRLPRYLGEEGIERFAEALVQESGVLILPASIFKSELGPTPGDRFRIGYGRFGMKEGLTALGEHLSARAGLTPGR